MEPHAILLDELDACSEKVILPPRSPFVAALAQTTSVDDGRVGRSACRRVAAADDASVIAARREAAADGDEAMEKLELSLNQLSEAAGVPSASEENSNKRARV